MNVTWARPRCGGRSRGFGLAHLVEPGERRQGVLVPSYPIPQKNPGALRCSSLKALPACLRPSGSSGRPI